MRGQKVVDVAGREVTVKELTVTQLDSLLGQEDYEATMLDRILEKDMLTGDLLHTATGISVQDLSGMAPSAMRPLVEAFKEVNPDFFEMARREVSRAQEMAKLLEKGLGDLPAS